MGITNLRAWSIVPSRTSRSLPAFTSGERGSYRLSFVDVKCPVVSMLSSLVETIVQVFGNAPHLTLTIISHYQKTGSIIRMPSHGATNGRDSNYKMHGEPNTESPTAPPTITLAKNSNLGGSQPQERDSNSVPHPHTSFSRSSSPTQQDYVARSASSLSSNLNPKPAPEPHPAPP
ncbi:hypothetical protein OPT61_g1175 [Boeremia exigua]|uniref:Uncharacterized protein n=1 Tax=Boeremia exigua TaxID=749465 RepID=A0ACC2IR58_9PLEO|nr:hypothetical protein OPT61_g1175 [Boeremia exigua]